MVLFPYSGLRSAAERSKGPAGIVTGEVVIGAGLVGQRAFGKGIDRERQALRHCLAQVEGQPGIGDFVAVVGGNLDFLVRFGRHLRFGHEAQVQRLVDLHREILAGNGAGLLDRGGQPAIGAHHRAIGLERHLRAHRLDRREAEAPGQAAARRSSGSSTTGASPIWRKSIMQEYSGYRSSSNLRGEHPVCRCQRQPGGKGAGAAGEGQGAAPSVKVMLRARAAAKASSPASSPSR
jgi:hypothetical protein